jgi:hypothetical protein
MISDSNIPQGVIYGLRYDNFKRLLSRKKPVYIKFIPHSNSKKHPTKISINDYLFFYISGYNKSIAGYAKIVSVSFKQPSVIEECFLDNIQMNTIEFHNYILNRESKNLLVLELNDIKEFKKMIPIDYPITMGGKYTSKEDTQYFLGKNRAID